jgi:arsenate reductase (thioredoxin)
VTASKRRARGSRPAADLPDRDFDIVITTCDEAKEACPLFPGARETRHWSFPDPAAVTGSIEQRLAAFRAVRDGLRERIAALAAAG